MKIGGNLNEFHFLDDFGYQRKTSKTLKPLKALDIISKSKYHSVSKRIGMPVIFQPAFLGKFSRNTVEKSHANLVAI